MEPSLDDEIERLQARISSLKNQIRIQTSTIITAPSTCQLLTEQVNIDPSRTQKLLAQSALQQAHNQQCLYRTCAAITTFRAHDPDPHAVDGGAILGLRLEVVSRARFLRPYYVLLNRPYSAGSGEGGRSPALRVHRHTLPPCIPLAGLAGRFLPAPGPSAGKRAGNDDEGGQRKRRRQDLAKFARALRREVVRYHHRLGVVADLRKAAGLGRQGRIAEEAEEGEEDGETNDERRANRLVEITPADAEAKQLTIEWADGRTGRLVMGDDGDIVKLVVVGENGRDWETRRNLLAGATTVEDVVKRLAVV